MRKQRELLENGIHALRGLTQINRKLRVLVRELQREIAELKAGTPLLDRDKLIKELRARIRELEKVWLKFQSTTDDTEGNIEKRGCSCDSAGAFGCASPYCEYVGERCLATDMGIDPSSE